MTKRVFVSFDFSRDKKLKDLIIAQSRIGRHRHPFEVSDLSLKEASKSKTWPRRARKRIKEAGVLMVMLGKETHRSPGVRKEVAMATKMHKPIVQIAAKKRRHVKPVPGAGPVLPWKWKVIRKALNQAPSKLKPAA